MRTALIGKQRDGVHKLVPFTVQAKFSTLGGFEAGYRLNGGEWVWTGQTSDNLDEALKLAGVLGREAIEKAEVNFGVVKPD